jgi:hypothetical protein
VSSVPAPVSIPVPEPVATIESSPFPLTAHVQTVSSPTRGTITETSRRINLDTQHAAFAELSDAESSNGFRRELVKAARRAATKGTITRREAVTVRIASFSPAFLERAQDLCVVQMAFSGDAAVDDLPRKASGEIDKVAIDWGGFASFLEAILPLILQLIAAFGA